MNRNRLNFSSKLNIAARLLINIGAPTHNFKKLNFLLYNNFHQLPIAWWKYIKMRLVFMTLLQPVFFLKPTSICIVNLQKRDQTIDFTCRESSPYYLWMLCQKQVTSDHFCRPTKLHAGLLLSILKF